MLVLITILAPILAIASVILAHQYNISPVNAITYLFLSIVENYNTPNTLALISFKTLKVTPSGSSSSITHISSGPVDVNISEGFYSESLVNFLAIYNLSMFFVISSNINDSLMFAGEIIDSNTIVNGENNAVCFFIILYHLPCLE